jgi:hypothetical protein
VRVHRDSATLDLLAAAATVARPHVPRRQQAIRERSRAARDSTLPQLAQRAAAILAWLTAHGPATDREVMHGLGFVDPNSVRPRISELIDARLVEECGERACVTTGQRVRVVRAA